MSDKGLFQKIIAILLVVSMVMSLSACGSSAPVSHISDPNSEVVSENIEVEHTITENTLNEFITSEIYLNEIVVVEDMISELLVSEETINEVILCKTIYVPEDNIEEFAANSQTSQLFGDDIDISSLLTKITVGTGVIITLCVLTKAGLAEPVASIVAAAADESLKFGTTGAAIGSLFGGMTGAADEVDSSGRTSAVIGFALATAGLILSIVSLVAEIPSGGSSSITAAAGVKLVIAGVSVAAATYGAAKTGYNAIKTFTSTDASEIDWDGIDWEKVGVSAAEQAINYGADGYMWGSLIGMVHGGADGYEYYQKHGAPYSAKDARIAQTPNKGGHWSGKRGESDFILDEPIELPNGIKVTKISYHNGIPDFSPYQVAQVDIPNMTNVRETNFSQADEALAKIWNALKHNAQEWKAADVKAYRKANNLTWHEMNNMEYMQLVPTDINSTFGHLGGVGEYNAMIGQEGVADFD